MLDSARLVAFIPTTDFSRSRAFYVDVLGFGFVSEDPFALVLDAFGTHVRASKVPKSFTHAQFTILGWEVSDIASAVKELQNRGVSFERFSFFEQDELGIWAAPGGGDKVAWFKDPDGNILSLSSHAKTVS